MNHNENIELNHLDYHNNNNNGNYDRGCLIFFSIILKYPDCNFS